VLERSTDELPRAPLEQSGPRGHTGLAQQGLPGVGGDRAGTD
jgi:hypothetical protein